MQDRTDCACVEYEVPYADTDMMGVVYYANYLVYFERARTQLLRNYGYSYRDMEADGYALPVVEAYLNYHKPATYSDILSLYGWIGWGKGVRCRIGCSVYRDTELIVDGYTMHACLRTADQRPVALPACLTQNK